MFIGWFLNRDKALPGATHLTTSGGMTNCVELSSIRPEFVPV